MAKPKIMLPLKLPAGFSLYDPEILTQFVLNRLMPFRQKYKKCLNGGGIKENSLIQPGDTRRRAQLGAVRDER